ncbi:MAG: helix-turn-helix domain-containing protein [Bryobacteraceae bacterium]|nr:helix-turn-helix domain-containing protein [Solibacteraceae bacterium]MCL4793500.1 helix-turn-helix domain-containing protein [Bryobacteraceae bacterium]
MIEQAIPRPHETYTPDEARLRLGSGKVSRNTFYKAIREKQIPHIRLGRRILIPRLAFERWLQGCGEAVG